VMIRYTKGMNDMILKVPEHCSYDVFDTNGIRLEFCVWCDTETGEAVHIITPIEHVINDAGEEVFKTKWCQHPAPLLYRKITS